MKYLRKIKRAVIWLLPHGSIVLGAAFITFWILDYLNPMIGFLDNAITDWLFLAFCIFNLLNGILSASLVWKHMGKKKRKAESTESEKAETE